MSEHEFQLRCRRCGAGFWGMLDLLKHQERCGQPAKQRRKARKNRAGVSRA